MSVEQATKQYRRSLEQVADLMSGLDLTVEDVTDDVRALRRAGELEAQLLADHRRNATASEHDARNAEWASLVAGNPRVFEQD